MALLAVPAVALLEPELLVAFWQMLLVVTSILLLWVALVELFVAGSRRAFVVSSVLSAAAPLRQCAAETLVLAHVVVPLVAPFGLTLLVVVGFGLGLS